MVIADDCFTEVFQLHRAFNKDSVCFIKECYMYIWYSSYLVI